MKLRLAVIIGSTRNGRFGPTVAGWFAQQAAKRAAFDVDLVDLVVANLPSTLTDTDGPRSQYWLRGWLRRMPSRW